jgi:hypothetical protein
VQWRVENFRKRDSQLFYTLLGGIAQRPCCLAIGGLLRLWLYSRFSFTKWRIRPIPHYLDDEAPAERCLFLVFLSLESPRGGLSVSLQDNDHIDEKPWEQFGAQGFSRLPIQLIPSAKKNDQMVHSQIQAARGGQCLATPVSSGIGERCELGL